MIKEIIDFTRHGIWRIPLKEVSRSKSFLIRQLRVMLVALRGFDEDRCMLWASGLTFYSLLSIVPIVAMLFGIAKGFGVEQRVEQELLDKFQSQQEVIIKVADFAHNLLDNTRGGLVAGVGIALLFWAIIKILGNVEKSFNHIWGVQQGRSWGRKFSDYLSLMLISPILLIMASSLTVFITSQVTSVTQRIEALNAVAGLIMFLLKFLPYLVIWVALTFVYFWMPNTKVRLNSALVAGVAGGTLFQITQWVYINFQIGAAKFGAIYGSFAALPLFLIWMQLSWLIVLLGAEIAFAHQNVETYEFEQDSRSASHSFKRLLSLVVAHQVIKTFCQGGAAPSATQISRTMGIPIRLVRQIVFELVSANVVSEVKADGDKSVSYQPARNVDALTISYVVDALEQCGSSDVPVKESAEINKLRACMNEFAGLIRVSDANMRLQDI